MANRFNSIDGTSPVVSALKADKIDVPRSAFAKGRLNVCGGLPFGMIIPIDYDHVPPKSTVKLNYDILITSRNPLVRKPFTGARFYVKTYKIYDRDLWRGAQNHVTRGRTGKLSKNIPRVPLNYLIEGGQGEDDMYYSFATPNSLADMLGVPIHEYDNSKDEIISYEPTEHVAGVYAAEGQTGVKFVYGSPDYANALPFVFYQKVARKFQNPNLLQDNENWYPEDEDDFILPYDCDVVNVLNYSNPKMDDDDYVALDHSANGPICVPTNDSDDSPVALTALHYAQFKGDYFNTGSPFPNLLRGEVPVLTLEHLAEEGVKSDITAITETAITASVSTTAPNITITKSGDTQLDSNNYPLKQSNSGNNFKLTTTSTGSSPLTREFNYTFVNSKPTSSINASAASTTTGTVNVADIASKITSTYINLNDLRALETYTLMRERMALCDGSYNSLIKTMFGSNPKSPSHEPEYVDGFYGDIMYNEVTATNGNDNNQLGQKASNGYAINGGKINEMYFEDYGYYMTVLYVVQDSMYVQGVDRLLSDLSYDDVYFPMKEALAPMPILNKELFYDNAEDNENDEPFAYTERDAWQKSRRNSVHGLVALTEDLAAYDNALVQKRIFSETPQFNQQFVTMSPNNVDMSLFSVPTSYPFDLAVNVRSDCVLPMSYVTTPKGLES